MSNPPFAKLWLLYVALAFSLGLNVVLWFDGGSSDGTQVASLEEDLVEDPSGETEVVEEVAVEPAAAAPETAPVAGWTELHAKVDQSLARTFQQTAGESGDALSSVFARLVVWDVNLRRDLQAGDAVAVVWRVGADGVPEIAAARLQSQKLGRTMSAYAWKAPGDAYPSFWHLDGTEVPLRLKEGPLAQYEQITSLLKDRPTHKGMDFKTPVGTEVLASRAGTVTRVNWNWGSNGNCIEIRNDDGVMAKYLHLSENKVAEGDKVRPGQVIALTGNTGHSTAPHLHYQLDRGTKTLDPLEYHGTERRSVDPAQVAILQSDTKAFQAALDSGGGQ